LRSAKKSAADARAERLRDAAPEMLGLLNGILAVLSAHDSDDSNRCDYSFELTSENIRKLIARIEGRAE
jgi:hypothetical protein